MFTMMNKEKTTKNKETEKSKDIEREKRNSMIEE